MQQALLALDHPAGPWQARFGGIGATETSSADAPAPAQQDAGRGAEADDPVAFGIGWDHARHGLLPDSALMFASRALGQGWQAARSAFGRRVLPARRSVRRWLALRLQAWVEGAGYDELQLTPHYLQQIEASHCPVTRRPLGGDGDHAPCISRLRQDAGYGAGQLVVLSRLARDAMLGVDLAEAQQRAARLLRATTADAHLHSGLDAGDWSRLVCLMGFARHEGPSEGAPFPLHVLPPNRVRVLQARQGLQVLLTLRLAQAGWSRRARAMADRLPRPTLRHDFQLFVGALAPRLMSIDPALAPVARRWALEDAWRDPRVQRRWALLAAQLDDSEAEHWLDDLAHEGLGGLHLVVHRPEAATEGWALRRGARSGRSRTCGRPPQNRSATTRPNAS